MYYRVTYSIIKKRFKWKVQYCVKSSYSAGVFGLWLHEPVYGYMNQGEDLK